MGTPNRLLVLAVVLVLSAPACLGRGGGTGEALIEALNDCFIPKAGAILCLVDMIAITFLLYGVPDTDCSGYAPRWRSTPS